MSHYWILIKCLNPWICSRNLTGISKPNHMLVVYLVPHLVTQIELVLCIRVCVIPWNGFPSLFLCYSLWPGLVPPKKSSLFMGFAPKISSTVRDGWDNCLFVSKTRAPILVPLLGALSSSVVIVSFALIDQLVVGILYW